MAGKKQPVEVVQAKGRKHLTKDEIRARKAAQIVAAADDIYTPTWLTKAQKDRFKQLAAELLRLEILANLDCEALARVVVAEDQYVQLTKAIAAEPMFIPSAATAGAEDEDKKGSLLNPTYTDLLIQQDRAWKQCRQGAADFGLTISHRCRLVAPKPAEPSKTNKFARFDKSGAAEAADE